MKEKDKITYQDLRMMEHNIKISLSNIEIEIARLRKDIKKVRQTSLISAYGTLYR